MAFEQASPWVRSMLQNGAFDVISGHRSAYHWYNNAREALFRRFGAGGELPYQAVDAVLRRYEAAERAGTNLGRRTTDNPLDPSDHVGMPGLPSSYQYVTLVTFVDPETDRRFTHRFTVDSNVPLGQESVRLNVEDQIEAFLDDTTYRTAINKAGELQWEGRIRIEQALHRLA